VEGIVRPFLLIARHFPPAAGGGVQRPAKLARYLVAEGWQPRVIAAPPFGPVDETLLSELPPEVEIDRLPVALAGRSLSFARKLRLGRLHRLITRQALLGDEGIGDLAETLGLALSKGRGAQAIVATSAPFSSVIAGALAAELLGLPLIADLRDPWAFAPAPNAASERHLRAMRRVESWALSRAEKVVIVTERMRPYIAPDQVTDAVLIPNGFDPADFRAPPEPRTQPSFRVAYAGSLYGTRRPEPLLEALQAVAPRCAEAGRPLELIVAGSTYEHESALRGAPIPIELRGYRTHAEAIALIRSADVVLVMVGTLDSDRLAASAKVYEAVAAGPPVIAWAPLDGEAAEVIARTGAGKTVADPKALEAALLEVLGGSAGVKPLPERSAALERYDRRVIAKRYAELLAQTSASTNGRDV
jgi:glycosyltransferase involved in cell wall biosynthesis